MSQPGRKENKHGYLVLTRSSTNILKRHAVYKYTQVPMFTLYYLKVITLYISFFGNIHSYTLPCQKSAPVILNVQNKVHEHLFLIPDKIIRVPKITIIVDLPIPIWKDCSSMNAQSQSHTK